MHSQSAHIQSLQAAYTLSAYHFYSPTRTVELSVCVCVCVDLDWIGSNKLCFFRCAHFRLNSKNWNKKKQGSNNSSGKQADYVELLYWRYCGIAIKNQKRKEIAVWVDSFTSHRFHVDAFSKLTQLWDSRAGAFATLCNWHESKSHAINISIIFFRV